MAYNLTRTPRFSQPDSRQVATPSLVRMLWFDELQRSQLAKYTMQGDSRAAWLREMGAVYLYGTIGHEAVLLRDGSVRLWSADQWPDDRLRCQGSGRVAHGIICPDCHGLGWTAPAF